jgi:hypothetical protein
MECAMKRLLFILLLLCLVPGCAVTGSLSVEKDWTDHRTPVHTAARIEFR